MSLNKMESAKKSFKDIQGVRMFINTPPYQEWQIGERSHFVQYKERRRNATWEDEIRSNSDDVITKYSKASECVFSCFLQMGHMI